MFRFTGHSDIEKTTKMILDEIVKAGSLHFGGKISLLGPIVNLNTAIKYFSQALATVFATHSFSHEKYQKLSELEKAKMRMKVVQHFVEKYGAKNNFYNLLHLKYHHYSGYFEGVYLLGEIFGVRLHASDENIKRTLVKEINLPLENCIADLLHKDRILTLAIGYSDHHSFFSCLPKELINLIGQATNAVHSLNRKI